MLKDFVRSIDDKFLNKVLQNINHKYKALKLATQLESSLDYKIVSYYKKI